MRRGMAFVLVVMLGLAGAACSGGDDDDKAAGSSDDASGASSETTAEPAEVVDPYEGYTSANYDGTTNWICHPDLADDQCRDLSATQLSADGTTKPADLEVAEDPPIDCFYVYPTTSTDPGNIADFDVDNSETATVRAQAAPFATQCRVFAPAYRQITIAGIFAGGFDSEAAATAYGDVLDAWKTYISQYNEGRGVVLIGHSQGTGHLGVLIGNEIAGKPELQDRLVSAILLGGSVTGFDGIPACETADQVGCVISYQSFPKDMPPAAGSFFGGAGDDGKRALCVDPTELAAGDDGLADAIVPTEMSLLGGVALGLDDVTTRYVVVPNALDLACESTDAYDYLSVAVAPDQDQTRLADFTNERLGPTWGLHLLDANVAMGNLLDIVAAEAKAFTGG
jgi:hypothetical protein